MVRSGGIEWLKFKYIYNIKMYLQMKMLTLNCESCLQNSILWRSIIFIKLVFYMVTFIYWNIMCTESCMYKYVFRKINKLHKKRFTSSELHFPAWQRSCLFCKSYKRLSLAK